MTTYELSYCYYKNKRPSYKNKRPSYNGVVVYGRGNYYKTDVSILVIPEFQNVI